MYSFKSAQDISVFAYPSASKTTTYSITASDYVIPCDDTAGSFTVTLPTAVGKRGKVYWIGKVNATLANAVTIATTSSQTISPTGGTTTTVNTQEEWVLVISDNANWHILERRIPSTIITFTPTGSWVANSTYTGYWYRTGPNINIEIQVSTSGAPTATTLSFNMPTGITIDNSSITGLTWNGISTAADNNGALIIPGFVGYANTTSVRPLYIDNVSGQLGQITETAPITFGANDYVNIYATIPVAGWKG